MHREGLHRFIPLLVRDVKVVLEVVPKSKSTATLARRISNSLRKVVPCSSPCRRAKHQVPIPDSPHQGVQEYVTAPNFSRAVELQFLTI